MAAQSHRDERRLTDADIVAIVTATIDALKVKCPDCQFEGISRDDLEHVVEFVKAFMKTINESKSVVLKTILTMCVGGCISLLAYGAFTRLAALLMP